LSTSLFCARPIDFSSLTVPSSTTLFLRLSNRLFPIEDLQKCEVYRVPFEPALNPSCCMCFPRRPRRPYFAFSIPMRSFLISRIFLDFSYSFLSFDFAFFAPSPPFVYFAFFASSLSLTFPIVLGPQTYPHDMSRADAKFERNRP
jgi:hypothetical protein